MSFFTLMLLVLASHCCRLFFGSICGGFESEDALCKIGIPTAYLMRRFGPNILKAWNLLIYEVSLSGCCAVLCCNRNGVALSEAALGSKWEQGFDRCVRNTCNRAHTRSIKNINPNTSTHQF